MGQSWNLGSVMGIQLRAHVTFMIMLVLGALLGGVPQVVFTVLLFGIVVLHELGHAMAASAFGIRTHDILLLPVGGMARLERQPATPTQEIVVALAGPAVNMALATLLVPLAAMSSHGLIQQLLWANVTLALFNLIPAFPMDGGRVLRAGLTWKLGPFEATRLAASIGKGAAIALGLAGLFVDPFLILIAGFVWFLADQEEASLPQVRVGYPARLSMRDLMRDGPSNERRVIRIWRRGTGWHE